MPREGSDARAGCGAPGAAAEPSDCGSAFQSAQGPRTREEARAAAMEVHRSSTGHTCRTEFEHDDGWQRTTARMQCVDPGNSSAPILPVSKPANDAAGRCQDDVLMAATPQILDGAQMRMSRPLHVSWSGGITWRSRVRHAGRARTVDLERTRPFHDGGEVVEAGQERCGWDFERSAPHGESCDGSREGVVAPQPYPFLPRAPWEAERPAGHRHSRELRVSSLVTVSVFTSHCTVPILPLVT